MAPITVVDYHKGNLSSVARGLAAQGAEVVVTDDPGRIARSSGIVVPGVGSFEDAMGYLRSSGQGEAILDAIARGVPYLGICLGMQILFERGFERADPGEEDGEDAGPVPGLGLLAGSCTRLVSRRLKVPHVGWDSLDLTNLAGACPILTGVTQGSTMYFIHSYVASDGVEEGIVAARTHYVVSFPSVVWRDRVFGCQFHPEKSSTNGARVLRGFVGVVEGIRP